MAAASDVVDQQPDRPAVATDEHVGIAIVVQVCERGAAAHRRAFERSARPLGDVLELPAQGCGTAVSIRPNGFVAPSCRNDP